MFEGSSTKDDNIYLPKLHRSEIDFFDLVSKGDVEAVQAFLKERPNFNVNCMNQQGQTPLMTSVQNKDESMVRYLLSLPNISIGDCALRAVQDNNINLTVILLDGLKKISPGLEFAGTAHSTEFPSYITPLILALQLGYYEISNLLLSRGHKLNIPHMPSCKCVKCKKTRCDDPLYSSSARLSVYRAISSPIYLIHQTVDQILAAFHLEVELQANAESHIHFVGQYLKLKHQVSTYAVDLLECCRTSQEVELILKQTSSSHARHQFVLPRLLMAVDYKQKEFVAHPNTQQVLESHWRGDWYSWSRYSIITKSFVIFSRVFFTPIMLLMCVLCPRHRLVRHWQIPLNKLITHASAYFVFLGLVFFISNQDKTKQVRGPPSTGAEAPLILYVCGFTWSAVRMMVMQGPKRYFSKMWNWTDMIMLTLFWLTFTFWSIFAENSIENCNKFVERRYWPQYEPTLIADGTFCLATIFAYFRLMQFCQLNYHLGPLQVSLGKMTIDIYKYIIVFTIIISAFAAGLARLYQYYEGMVYEDEFGIKIVQWPSFISLQDTLKTLFWALFCMSPLESADVVLANKVGPKRIPENKHQFTERIGYFCFGCFEVISVIVVLNMMIATMSNTFQRVTDNVTIEWTFGRTEVYVHYMWQTTLPSPLNMVPTAAALGSVLQWLQAKSWYSNKDKKAKCSLSHCCYIDRDQEASLQKEYPALMSVLLQRYFRKKASYGTLCPS